VGGQSDRTEADGARAPLHQQRTAVNGTGHMNGTVCRDAGDPKTGTLLCGHTIRQRNDLRNRDHRVFRGSAEWTIRSGAVTPHAAVKPVRRHAVADSVDVASAIAVRDDARVRHAVAECVLSFLDVAEIDPGGGDPNPDLARTWSGVRHYADL
jgi:hypothetical protein